MARKNAWSGEKALLGNSAPSQFFANSSWPCQLGDLWMIMRGFRASAATIGSGYVVSVSVASGGLPLRRIDDGDYCHWALVGLAFPAPVAGAAGV